MKYKISVILIATIIVTICLMAYAQKPSLSQDYRKWEYASLVLLPTTEAAFWRGPDGTVVEESSLIGLAIKLGCDKPAAFPPEHPILNHFGNKGWELVQIVGPKDSMCDAFVCWFKRPITP